METDWVKFEIALSERYLLQIIFQFAEIKSRENKHWGNDTLVKIMTYKDKFDK